MKCDHYIGMWLDYEDTTLVTRDGLCKNVEDMNQYSRKEYQVELEDYFDLRKSVNLVRFDYCPNCGEKLDWRKMKNEI